MSLRRTSKDSKFFLLPSSLIETKSWQKPKSLQSSQFQGKYRTPPKILTKKVPKNPPQKILPKDPPKNFSQKIPPKKFGQKSSSKKSSWKISKEFRKKFLRFWKHPISFIALKGRKPFQACFLKNSITYGFPVRVFSSYQCNFGDRL